MAGIFIVLEGGDGVGKTSAARSLAERVRETGSVVSVIENPGSTPTGQAIRGLLIDPQVPLTPKEQVLLYTAARSSVAAVIQDRLDDNEVVICTRWLLSTLVYQNPRTDTNAKHSLRHLAMYLHDEMGLFDPNICVLLDCDPEIALPRCGLRPNEPADRFQRRKIAWHRSCREDFLAAAKEADYPIVAADGTPEQTADAVWEACLRYPSFARRMRQGS